MIKAKHTTWNLKPLFKSDNDPAMAHERKKVGSESYKFINKWRDRTDYLEKPEVLKEALDEYEHWLRFYGAGGDEETYFLLRSWQDQNDPKIKAKCNQIQDFSNKILNDIQFFALKIARIPSSRQKEFLDASDLRNYRHWLEKIFAESKYLLSEPEEKIMNLKSAPAYINWVNMTEGFLAKEEREVLDRDGKKAKKSFSEILSLTSDKKKRIRDTAAYAVNEIFKKNADVVEAEMNSIMADKKINDELRGFPRPDSAMHLSDDISSEVADVLVGAAHDKFDISKRYYRLKARLFGVKKLKYHERNVEYGNIDRKYSYSEAVNMVFNIFDKVDKNFSAIFKKFIENGQIDVFPKKGKHGGGFCFHHLINQQTYILLNHAGTLKDVFTIAHESGHGINNCFKKKKQNALSFSAPLFMAETASKFAEEMVFAEILETKDEEFRLAMMMMKLNDEIVHVFLSAAENKFELELHKNFRQKGYLSKEEIGQLWKKHTARFMGSFVEQTAGMENWWMHITHLRVFFYNYQYASGILIGKALYSYYKETPAFIEKIKEILSAGSSDSPENVFKKVGIDITDKKFWDQGINEVEKLLNAAEGLAKKLKKI